MKVEFADPDMESAVLTADDGPRLVVFPELPSGRDGEELLSRLTWYLLPTLQSAGGEVFVRSDAGLPREIETFDYFDPSIPFHYQLFLECMREVGSFDALVQQGVVAEAVFCLDKARIGEARELAKALGDAEVVLVDPQTEQFESSKYLRFGSDDCRMPVELVETYRDRLSVIKGLCDNQTVGIFGTGPSLDDVTPETFSSCFNIATNSMIVDRELMDAVKPRVIVASDPIFHAGCSSYAADFRQQLIEQVLRHDAYFVFPARDYHIYEFYLRPIRDKLIGIPMVPVHDLAAARNRRLDPPMDRYAESFRLLPINAHMDERFFAVVTNNVLTFMLLPLASALSTRAIGAGFDGRDPDADGYFWSHAKKSQINDKMDDIKVCHPGFFDIDYNEYYEAHTSTLTRQLHYLDREGFRFACITSTHVPPLKSRMTADPAGFIASRGSSSESSVEETVVRPRVTVVMPNYNSGILIERAINSVIAQDMDSWELLIVDNGSSDTSLEIIKRYAVMDRRVRWVHNPVKGVSASRNLGIDLSRGEYVCFLDSDDELWANSLSSRAKVLDDGGSLSFGRAEFTNDRNQSLRHTICAKKDLDFDDFRKGNPVHTGTVMGRRSIIASERFREDLHNGEDYLYFARLARMGYVYRYAGGRVSTYRMHAESVTQKDMFLHNRKLEIVHDFLTAETKGHPFYEARFTSGVEDNPFAATMSKRDFAALVHVVCRGDRDSAFQVKSKIDDAALRSMSEKTPYHRPGLTMRVDEIEVVAMRSVAEPKSSRTLYQKAFDASDVAYAVIVDWYGKPDIRGDMADRLRAFMRRCAKQVIGDAERFERQIGVLHQLRDVDTRRALEAENARKDAKAKADASSAREKAVPVASGPGAVKSSTPSKGKPAPSAGVRLRVPSLTPAEPVKDTVSETHFDLIDPESADGWEISPSGKVEISEDRIVLARQGQGYERLAIHRLNGNARGCSRVALDVSEMSHALDLAVNGRRIAKIESTGSHEVELPQIGSSRLELSLTPADNAMATVTLTRLWVL